MPVGNPMKPMLPRALLMTEPAEIVQMPTVKPSLMEKSIMERMPSHLEPAPLPRPKSLPPLKHKAELKVARDISSIQLEPTKKSIVKLEPLQ